MLYIYITMAGRAGGGTYKYDNKRSAQIGEGVTRKYFEMTTKSGKMINLYNIKKELEQLQQNLTTQNPNKQIVISVIAKGKDGVRVLKTDNESWDDMIERYEQYLRDKVSSISKFKDFYRLGVTIKYKDR